VDQNRGRPPGSPPDDEKLKELVSAVADSQKEAGERARAAAEAYRKQRGKHARLPFLLLLVAIATGVLVVTRLATPSPLPVSPAQSARETIYVTVLALNAEFEETGAFPEELEAIGMDEEGLTYTMASEGYTLVMEEEGFTVEYSYGEDLTPFQEAFEALAIGQSGTRDSDFK
jgi:hypothetical protein